MHLYAGRHYGYFVDELYYLACARHLDWGYVDQPPLIAIVTRAWTALFGQSLPAIRLLPAIAGAFEVWLAAQLAREMGGGRFAQILAAIATLCAPAILVGDNMLTMNAFEPLIWMGCAWLVLRIINSGNQRLWIWFGVLAGIGLENKYSMLIFGTGVVAGLVLTPERRILANRWLWIGGALAFALFLPNLIWNVQHGFPFLELQANIRRSGRDVALNPLSFFAQEILAMHPLALPVWIAGLWFYFRAPAGRRYRALGWAWVFAALIIVTMSPRVYYLFPAFPLLFAGGAIQWEQWLSRPSLAWVRAGYAAILLISAAILAQIAIPILDPERYLAYTRALHLEQPRIENHRLGPLPQLFADQFGWEEMTAEVARIYNGLPPDVRAQTAIFGQGYGQAGAIDLFGPRYGLPPAISGHQSYFLWGPRDYTGASMIVMAGDRRDLESQFESVEKAGHVEHPYSMPYEHFDIFYCRGLRQPLREMWPKVKNWD